MQIETPSTVQAMHHQRAQPIYLPDMVRLPCLCLPLRSVGLGRYLQKRVARRVKMLTGMALMPMAMLIAHSTPLTGCTLKKRPTGVCMIITCNTKQNMHVIW